MILRSKKNRYIGILGGGGQASELKSFLPENLGVAFMALNIDFLSKDDPGQIDILRPTEKQQSLSVVAAVGAPLIRKKLISDWPGSTYETVIGVNTYIDKSAKINEGSIIAPGVIITADTTIGAHAIINIGATISHDCVIGSYSTVGPGAHVGGNVSLGDGAFIGVGAVVKNDILIASGVVVGAGSVVIHDLDEENAIYAGVPAKKIGQNKTWLSKIK